MKCLVIVCVILFAALSATGDKVLMDWVLNLQLSELNRALAAQSLITIDVGDFSLDDGLLRFEGVRLGDLSTLKGTDHSYMWTSAGNLIEAEAYVGLGNMTVWVDRLTYNNRSFPAVLTVGLNSLGFHQSTRLLETSCSQNYSKIAFYQLDQVTMYSTDPDYNNQDVSEFVKMRILRYVNGLMQQTDFLNWVQKYLDVCNRPTMKLFHK